MGIKSLFGFGQARDKPVRNYSNGVLYYVYSRYSDENPNMKMMGDFDRFEAISAYVLSANRSYHDLTGNCETIIVDLSLSLLSITSKKSRHLSRSRSISPKSSITSKSSLAMRTLVFQTAAVLIFPLFWQVDGIRMSIVAAEMMAVAVTAVFLQINQKKYEY